MKQPRRFHTRKVGPNIVRVPSHGQPRYVSDTD